MKRTLPLFLSVVSAAFLLTRGCIKEPVASFKADKTTIDAGESVQFSDQSENEPDIWEWSFEGGTPAASKLPDPVVSYPSAGSFSVSLEVRNRKDSDAVTMSNYITVLPSGTDVTFVNNTHTPVDILVGDIVKNIPIGDSVTYHDLEGTSVDFYAETYATMAGGDQIGRLLYWDYFVNLPGGKISYQLDIGTGFFFLYITNSGTRTIGPVEVYDGDAEPLVAGVGLPNNGSTYRIGYYNAWGQTHVRAYHQDIPTQYTYWNVNQNFNFPQVMNQSVTLNNEYKKGTSSVPVPEPAGDFLQDAMEASERAPVLNGEGVRIPAKGSRNR
jgi:hypothetical protein